MAASSFAHGDRRSQARQSASGLRCKSSNEPHLSQRPCRNQKDAFAAGTKGTLLESWSRKRFERPGLSIVRSIASSLLSQKSPRLSSRSSRAGMRWLRPTRPTRARAPLGRGAFVDRDLAAAEDKLRLLTWSSTRGNTRDHTRGKENGLLCDFMLLLRPRSDDLFGFVHNCEQILSGRRPGHHKLPGLQGPVAARLPSLSAACWRKSWTRECTIPPDSSDIRSNTIYGVSPRVQTQRPQFSSISVRTARSSSSCTGQPERACHCAGKDAYEHQSCQLCLRPWQQSTGLRALEAFLHASQPALSRAQTRNQAESCRQLGLGCAPMWR